MIENIGQKIKRVRKEMNLTQDNVHHNQSQISQIESGRINNPDENTLEIIAANLKLTLDELIENTGWEKPESPVINTDLGFSPVMVDVELDDTGNITWAHKTYPMYNSKGEKNEFCPKSGMKLITHCEQCERQVEDTVQEYCYSCGYNLFGKIEILDTITEIIDDNLIFTDQDICANAIGALGYERMKINRALNKTLMWELTQRRLRKIKHAIEDQKNLVEKIEHQMKENSKKNKKLKDKEVSRSLAESKALLKDIKVGIVNKEKELEELERIPHPGIDQAIYWRFNLQIVDSAIKKLKGIVNSLELPPPITIEETKMELYAKLANMAGQHMMQVLDPYGMGNIMKSFDNSEKSTEPESDEKKREEIKKMEQVTKMMQQIEKIKDPAKLMEIMKDFIIPKNQKISTDSDEDKSESTENNDSSSNVEEKSNKRNKKGA